MRFFRACLVAGLVVAAFLFLPPAVQTTNAAVCHCGGSAGDRTETGVACSAVTDCTVSGCNLPAGSTAPTCSEDTAPAAPAQTTPETPDASQAVGAANNDFCGSASGLDEVKCQILLLIADVLNIVASFLGKVLVFLVDILISFASYNGFGNAIVVQRGWVVVRDVVNMFFIVVLLISAFATIIGYDTHSFHYKNVLPKLLLMAVLINFSRTLIQLLIDFSQVVMLTFVNAFASAGPGNLVSALKLDQVLRMASPTQGGTSVDQTAALVGTVDPVNIILALMLAVFMLSISLGVVIIMTAYLIFRIVGIWVALILSPIAFFATALPGRLQKGMGQFTGKYWGRLSALLTGGPVMAFFLWLTFAVTQSSAGQGGLAQVVDIQTNNPTVSFLTSIGNSQDIASFIVGVTLMLMGLDAAVSAANEVSSTLGGFAQRVGGASQALGRLAAASPALLGYYGARAGGQAIGAGAAAINRRANVTGTVAAGGLALANRVLPTSLAQRVRPSLIAATKGVEKGNRGRAEANVATMEGMKTADKAALLTRELSSNLNTADEKKVYAQRLTELAGDKDAQKMKDSLMPQNVTNVTDIRRGELAAQGLTGDALKTRLEGDKDMIKNRASQLTDRQVAAQQAEFLQTARKAADAAKDNDTVRQIDDQLKKNPQLSSDPASIAKKLVADPKSIGNLSPQAKSDMGNLYEMLKASGAVQENPDTKIITGFDRAKLDAFRDKVTDKETKENLDMMVKLTSESPNTYDRARLQQLAIGRDEKGRKRILNLPTDGRAASPEPVISRMAQNAKTALDNIKRSAGAVPGPNDIQPLRDAVVENIKYNGLTETINSEANDSPVVTQFTEELKNRLANNDFSLVASVGRDIKGLSSEKQEKILNDIGNQITNRYKTLRSTGKSTKDIDNAYKNLVEVAAAIKSSADSRGVPAPENIKDMVEDIKATLYSADDKERKQLPSSLKVIVEDEETHS
jgi:hypothetical protein